jgi:hypothetical protein
MKSPRMMLIATVVLGALVVPSGAAAAHAPKESFAYYATIDCGSGPIEVGSGEDLWSPLVDLKKGKSFQPVAWNVSGDGFSVVETRKGEQKKPVACHYNDGVATGTVTVVKRR